MGALRRGTLRDALVRGAGLIMELKHGRFLNLLPQKQVN